MRNGLIFYSEKGSGKSRDALERWTIDKRLMLRTKTKPIRHQIVKNTSRR